MPGLWAYIRLFKKAHREAGTFPASELYSCLSFLNISK